MSEAQRLSSASDPDTSALAERGRLARPLDARHNVTASGIATIPAIRLLSVGRSRWGKDTDRLHPHVYTALVAMRTVDGGGVLRFSGENGTEDLPISGPSVVLFNDGILERVMGVRDRWVAHWFEFISPEAVPLPQKHPLSIPYTSDEAAATDAIQSDLVSPHSLQRAHAAARFAGLLYGWFREEPMEPDEQSVRTVERAMAIFRDRVYEPTSVESVAHNVGVHPVTLRRLFREHLKQSPKQYYDDLRISESRRLLETGMLAKQVAARLGYQSARHYGRVFKEHVGLTVREFRRRYGHDESCDDA